MLNIKSWRLTGAVAAVAVLIVAAGGVAIASNMAFKLNLGLYTYRGPLVAVCNIAKTFCTSNAGCPTIGDSCVACPNCGKNLVSFPYFNPYIGAPCTIGTNCTGAFCSQAGLPAAFPATIITSLNQLASGAGDPTVGFASGSCGGSANAQPLVAGRAYEVLPQPLASWSPLGVARGVIIVGSHNPSQQVTITTYTGLVQTLTNGDTYFSVPYHTTAATAGDLCSQMGLTSAFPASILTRHEPGNPIGQFTPGSCGTTANNLTLRLGEGIRIHQRLNTVTVIPAHF